MVTVEVEAVVFTVTGCSGARRERGGRAASGSVCVLLVTVTVCFLVACAYVFDVGMHHGGAERPRDRKIPVRWRRSRSYAPLDGWTVYVVLVSPYCRRRFYAALGIYYGFQTVCKCPFRALLVTSATDSNQTWTN